MSHEKACLPEKYSVLLLIADQLCGETVAAHCKDAPVKVVLALTAADALAIVAGSRPDMILIDADLSGEDPVGLYAACKADGELRDVPLIVLVSSTEDRAAFLQNGCQDFLNKPLGHHALHEKLHQYLALHAPGDVRVPYHTPVIINDKNDKYFGLSKDMSEHGIFVATYDRIPEKEEIRLSFALAREEPLPIEVKGRVAWINSKQSPVSSNLPEGFGMEFTGISTEEHAAIKDFIADTTTK